MHALGRGLALLAGPRLDAELVRLDVQRAVSGARRPNRARQYSRMVRRLAPSPISG
jgi:hypothetical protein